MGKVLYPAYFPILPNPQQCLICADQPAIDSFSCFVDPLANYNLSDMMAIYWRIRRWKITLDYTTDCESGAISKELYFKSSADTERDLVCGHILLDEGGYDAPPLAAVFQFCVNDCQSGLKFAVKFNGNEDCYLSETAVGQAQPCRDFSEINGGQYNLIIYGTVQVTMYNTFSDQFGSGVSVDKVEAVEWWSYGGTYDTATGAPL